MFRERKEERRGEAVAAFDVVNVPHSRFSALELDFNSRSLHNANLMTNPLFDICCERNSDPVEQRDRIVKILQRGVDINATDKNGVTALHHAVRFRSPIAVKTLVEHGANVNQACRKSGSTPLHRAVT
jgi:ankyrin repeat protein